MTSKNQSHLWRIVGVFVVVVLVAIVAVIGLRPTQRATFRSIEAPPTDAPSTGETASPEPSASEADQLLGQAIRLWLSDDGADLEQVRQLLEDAAAVSPHSVEVKGALAIFWAERFADEKSPEAQEKAVAYAVEVEAIDPSSPLAKIGRALLRAVTQQPQQNQEAGTPIGEALEREQNCLPKQLCDYGYRLLDEARMLPEDRD